MNARQFMKSINQEFMQQNTQLSRQEVQAQAKHNTKKIKELLKKENFMNTLDAYKLARQTNALFTHEFLDLPERLEFLKVARFYKKYIVKLVKIAGDWSVEAHKEKNTAEIKESESILFDLQKAFNYFQELSNCLTLKLFI